MATLASCKESSFDWYLCATSRDNWCLVSCQSDNPATWGDKALGVEGGAFGWYQLAINRGNVQMVMLATSSVILFCGFKWCQNEKWHTFFVKALNEVGRQSRKQFQPSTNHPCRYPALQLTTCLFCCRQTDFDKVYPKVETMQSINMHLLLSTALYVLAVFNSEQEVVFESDLNSDWFYFCFM